mmetsp:Transcript_17320/g.38882  ORF Transcript_17320/g.38882 Transcript_17320/m.38882 type:complete len:103 (-) Transcript_17320:2-310(-)
MALSLHLPYNISRLYQLTTPHFRLHQLTSYMHSLRARASKAGRRARAERQRTASDASPSPFIPVLSQFIASFCTAGSTFSSLISSQRLLCDYTQNPMRKSIN